MTNTHIPTDNMLAVLNDPKVQEELSNKFDEILIASSDETRKIVIEGLNEYRKNSKLRMRAAKSMLFFYLQDESIKADVMNPLEVNE